jgi:DNA-binding NarL/FixJ family response regulator
MNGPIRVMIAEDIEVLRRDFCEMIERCPGMELVGAAASGEEIVRLALAADVDIILMDIEMASYNDGVEAAGLISADKPETGIIFLTVHEDEETIFKAYSIAAAKNYLVKSTEHEEILQSIRAAYKEKCQATPSVSVKIRGEFSRLKQTELSLIWFMNIMSQITLTEKEIIRLLLENRKVEEIARMRHVEPVTIKSQINKLLKKFNMTRTREVMDLIRKLKLTFLFENE